MPAVSQVLLAALTLALGMAALVSRAQLAELRRAHAVAQSVLRAFTRLNQRDELRPPRASATAACVPDAVLRAARYRRNQARPRGSRLNRSSR
jgi:hypothetical protein